MSKQIKRMDLLWASVIKARAGNVSELSGGGEHDLQQLESHHIANKPNYHLRYSLDNGICITYHEHRYEAHADEAWGRSRLQAIKGRTKKQNFKLKVIKLRGRNIYERLQAQGRLRTKVDLDEVEIFLKAELKKYK